MKHKALDVHHFMNCHKRWRKFGNRDLTKGEQPQEWIDAQCQTCAYYVPLMGKFSDDYGACTNGDSAFDGKVMFEHDGCDKHAFSEDFPQFSISHRNDAL